MYEKLTKFVSNSKYALVLVCAAVIQNLLENSMKYNTYSVCAHVHVYQQESKW